MWLYEEGGRGRGGFFFDILNRCGQYSVSFNFQSLLLPEVFFYRAYS